MVEGVGEGDLGVCIFGLDVCVVFGVFCGCFELFLVGVGDGFEVELVRYYWMIRCGF